MTYETLHNLRAISKPIPLWAGLWLFHSALDAKFFPFPFKKEADFIIGLLNLQLSPCDHIEHLSDCLSSLDPTFIFTPRLFWPGSHTLHSSLGLFFFSSSVISMQYTAYHSIVQLFVFFLACHPTRMLIWASFPQFFTFRAKSSVWHSQCRLSYV